MLDVQERFEALAATRPTLRWYALVDGFQYTQHRGERITARPGVNRALFAGTEDAPLAHAGPWLYDMARCPEQVAPLAALERSLPSVSWLITTLELEGLAQVMQLKLDAELPIGKKALLRCQDPRVLAHLFAVMDAHQKAQFFGSIDEWHFIANGTRVWVGQLHA